MSIKAEQNSYLGLRLVLWAIAVLYLLGGYGIGRFDKWNVGIDAILAWFGLYVCMRSARIFMETFRVTIS